MVDEQIDPRGLVRRAALRDFDAFQSLYEEHLPPVYRFVLLKVGDTPLAKDLTAKVLSSAWENIERFQWRQVPFQHWLLKIARDVVVDHWRANRRSVGDM